MIAGAQSTVYIVDDDASVRKSLRRLVGSAGYNAIPFSSAKEFLESPLPSGPSCLVLDICMPDMDGLQLQETINALDDRCIPIVFITGHGDVPMSVKALKGGAVDFLLKPFNDGDLFRAIQTALQKDRQIRGVRARKSDIRQLLDTLTPREREVMRLVVTGMLNKQVAGRLGVAEKTVKVHRGRVMKKMKVQSFAELVRIAQESGIKSPVPVV